jgi:hypothetical protein
MLLDEWFAADFNGWHAENLPASRVVSNVAKNMFCIISKIFLAENDAAKLLGIPTFAMCITQKCDTHF